MAGAVRVSARPFAGAAVRLGATCLAITLLVPTSAMAADAVGGMPADTHPALAQALPSVGLPAGSLHVLGGRELWARSADDERAMASTTKIMTALVTLERADLDDEVTISAAAVRVGEAGVVLKAGQRLTVRELLEAILVRSANNAAYALAEHVAGGSEEFVRLMNEKADSLGLTHTSFANPHGLDAAGHYTSARDLALLTSYAMADPVFRQIVALPSISVPSPSGKAPFTYENSNKLLGSYEGATGVKTGWTNRAGYCVVASAERGGIELVAVVLGAKDEADRFRQARTLLDWGFSHYAYRQVTSAETTAAVVPVTDYLDRSVEAVVAETTEVPVFDLEGEVLLHAEVVEVVTAPVSAGQRLGTLNVVQGERLLAQVPIVAAADVAAPGLWERVRIGIIRGWRGLFGGQTQAAYVPVM